VSDADARLDRLSPERRRAFELMLRRRGAAARAAAPGPPPAEGDAALPAGPKREVLRFYESVNERLDPTPFGPFSCFLNYGYVADGSPEHAAVDLPQHYLNRSSVKLVLEVIGDAPLAGSRVLDVGCGRGGTAQVLGTFFRPALVAGVDLSARAVRFCARTHAGPGAGFLRADAEALPFRDAAFDAVVNIESSHLYPDVAAFFGDALRVLRPGGYFLYADLQPAGAMEASLALLRRLGFSLRRVRDVTHNVVLSCGQVAGRRAEAYAGGAGDGTLREFLAAPGSEGFEALRTGAWRYHIVVANRAGGHAP
jgi:phthiocerol/phenolphthiocerol synthesis type-I polyketide synthase E